MKVVLVPQAIITPLDNRRQIERIRSAAGAAHVVLAATEEEQLRELADAEVLFGDVTPTLLAAGPNLRWVQCVGAGVDSFAAMIGDRPVRLTGVRGLVGTQLAEHAFALLLSLTRGVAAAVRTPGWDQRQSIRRAQWELTDRTIGIVGLGGSGLAVARRARGFEFERIVGVEPNPVDHGGIVDRVVHPEDIDALLPDCDVVVLTLPLTPDNRGWFDADRIARMRAGSILINVSRGGLVVTDALVEALERGHLRGAGLDVLAEEPPSADHPIWSAPNAIVTPHIAGGSPLRADRVVDHFCENLRRYQSGQELLAEYDAARGF